MTGHASMYDTCACGVAKKRTAQRCRSCAVVARYGDAGDRLARRTRPTASGCVEWLGQVSSSGYGRISWNGRVQQAHRVAYEVFVGRIPDGLVLDHLCRNKLCVNPAHLEPVTEQVNIVRGTGPSAENHAKETCREGHEFDAVKINRGRPTRVCLTCKRAREKATKPAWRARRADACRVALEEGR